MGTCVYCTPNQFTAGGGGTLTYVATAGYVADIHRRSKYRPTHRSHSYDGPDSYQR